MVLASGHCYFRLFCIIFCVCFDTTLSYVTQGRNLSFIPITDLWLSVAVPFGNIGDFVFVFFNDVWEWSMVYRLPMLWSTHGSSVV